MKRRGFLQLLGFGVAAKVIPADILKQEQIVTSVVTDPTHAGDAVCYMLDARLWSQKITDEFKSQLASEFLDPGCYFETSYDYGNELKAIPASYPDLSDEQPHDSPEDSL